MPVLTDDVILSAPKGAQEFLRMPMQTRIKEISFRSGDLSPEDIVAIVSLSNNVEAHPMRRYLFTAIIDYYPHKFNRDAFLHLSSALTPVPRSEEMTKLCGKSEGLTDSDKIIVVKKAVLYNQTNFVAKDGLKIFGIDVYSHPFNVVALEGFIRHVYASEQSSKLLWSDVRACMFKILKLMDKNSVVRLFETDLIEIHINILVKFIMEYIDIPFEILYDFFHKTDITNKKILVTHQQADANMQLIMFNLTGDKIYLSETAQNLFMW